MRLSRYGVASSEISATRSPSSTSARVPPCFSFASVTSSPAGDLQPFGLVPSSASKPKLFGSGTGGAGTGATTTGGLGAGSVRDDGVEQAASTSSGTKRMPRRNTARTTCPMEAALLRIAVDQLGLCIRRFVGRGELGERGAQLVPRAG
jgi:hypothetical protein